MIISYQSHKKIDIHGGGIKVIATRSQIAYRDLIGGFKKTNAKIICLDNKFDRIDVNKNFDFVGDIHLTDKVLDKYMLTIINKYISGLDEVNRNKIFSEFYKLESLVNDSLLLEDIPLSIDFSQDLKKFLKLENLHLNTDYIQDSYDILETIIKIHQQCNLMTIPVVCNVAHYLNETELNEINQLLKQTNLKMILIEFTDPKFMIIPEDAEFYYIDEDLVDWY